MRKKEFILFIFVFLPASGSVKLNNESQSDLDEKADDDFHSEPMMNIFTAKSKNKFQARSPNNFDAEIATSFSEVLTVKKIKEEQVQQVEIIQLTEPEGCYYDIDSQYPAADYFRVIDLLNHSKAVIAGRIDREDSVFKDMKVASCIVNLRLFCKSANYSREKEEIILRDTPEKEVWETPIDGLWKTPANGIMDAPEKGMWEPPCSYDSTDKSNIATDPFRMIIVVIIEDINDNAPVFLEQPFLVYPSNYEFLRKYNMLNGVAVIKATDADIGENAEIRYKISDNRENPTFAIHPVTGELYQLRKINSSNCDRSIKLTIEATDGMQTSLNDITINLLNDTEMVEVLYTRGLLESVDEKFRNLSTEFDISILTAHQLPTNVTKLPSNLSDSENVLLMRAFLYAVERNDSKIVQSEVLAKFLREQNWMVEVNLVTELMSENNRTNNNNDDPNNDDNTDENDDNSNGPHNEQSDASSYGWFTWFMISLFVMCLVLIACKIVFTIYIQRQNDVAMKMWNERHGVSSLNLEDDPTANDNPWISAPNLDLDFSYAKPATPIPQTRETIGISRDHVSYKPDGHQTDCNFENKIF